VRIDNPPPISKAVPGQPAPDFVAPLLVGNEPIRLRKLRGKPTLLFFFSPTSRTADQMLRFAQSLHAAHFRELHVVGLAMSDDATSLQGQCLALGVMFPIASGTSLHATYDLESTPKVFLLDPEGVVRATYVGWGGETPTTIEEEARTWIRRSKP
jgi:peroxiredoxin